ncbi:heparan-alpha-glucosaminide N-acetyltransferase [Manganibacter manganicus]|uniref:Heparan-alpha-glucosaminide N-acetyltransferase catalytic domain-containing protein n=1 Tax=Manganibacter manganicus TaxID=1873176 RepID=A0A1V8RW82_9HYPH|nr:DUF1624 domain-containing protein [Pseudaminobacter manganicus]OQM77446.1 hypothetical protein BFN67_00970 [Pseudaminobacter manganicus]
MASDQVETSRRSRGRIAVIDIARGLALLAMASYHFTWDLEFFGYAPAGLTEFGGWKLYARGIASSFLILVGVSLYLAHARGIRWNGFWKRLAMVVAAALAITIVTRIAVPDGFIFFGILHEIALASLLGLAFLRLPALLTLIIAALVIAAPHYLRSTAFDHPALWWIGLSTIPPRSNDFVPVLPWFGAVLAGLGITRLADAAGILDRLAKVPAPRAAKPLTFIGKHSLAFYLIHQPVLIGCVWLFSQMVPAPAENRQVNFLSSCQASCEQKRDSAFCNRYCGCMLETLQSEGSLDKLYGGEPSAQFKTHIGEMASVCTLKTDSAEMGVDIGGKSK